MTGLIRLELLQQVDYETTRQENHRHPSGNMSRSSVGSLENLAFWSQEIDQDFDRHFPRVHSRLPSPTAQLGIALSRRRMRWTINAGLVEVVGEIFRHRLFESIEKVDEQNSKIHGIIIITDKHSQAMIERTVGWICSKRFGIRKIFTDEDSVSNELTAYLQVVYLVNLVNTDDRRFKSLLRDLNTRISTNCSVFLTHLIDPFDRVVSQRIKSLQKVIDSRKLSPPWIVGAFNVVNPWIAVLEGEDPQLNYLREKIARPRASQNTQKNRLMAMKMAFRLINVFEQMNQLPIIRYFKSSWHDHNRLIADLCHNGLEATKEKRRATGSTVKYGEDFTLIILDRTCDLITPILHSNDLQAFVAQELELHGTAMYSSFLDPSFRNIPMTSMATKLMDFFQSLSQKYVDMSFQERESAMKMVDNFLFLARQALSSIESGYSRLIAYEIQIMTEFSSCITQSDNKILNQFFQKRTKRNSINETQLTLQNFDLLRLVLLVTSLTDKNINDAIRSVGKKASLDSVQRKLVYNYKRLTKKLLDVNRVDAIGLPFIAKVIELYYQHLLPDEMFPVIRNSRVCESNREKLCIFVVGGLSYNEMKYAGSDGKRDVILLSSSFLTPKLLLSEVYPDLFAPTPT